MKIVLFLLFAALVLAAPKYKVVQQGTTSNGEFAKLQLVSGSGPYGNDIAQLDINVYYETESRVHVKITDTSSARWQVPYIVQSTTPGTAPSSKNYKTQILVNTQDNNAFQGIQITRISDNQVIFDTTGSNFVFSDQYLELTNKFPSDVVAKGVNLYGIGENIHSFRMQPRVYTIWNRDHFAADTNVNLYGTHPFYLELRNGASHGVFLLNSNAMDVEFTNSALQYRVIGGVFDFFLFTGTDAESVIQQYQQVIGRPHMPSYWSLGFMQSRWGYKNIDETAQVVANYSKYGIPLDDYMDGYRDFTTDPVNYPLAKVQQFVDTLHKNDQKYVVIIDPGIKVDPGYPAYDMALQDQVYITKADGKTPFQNKVWPGLCIFPDFSNPKTSNYWAYWIKYFKQNVNVDGLWIDMNEVAAFCDGECSEDAEEKTKSMSKDGFNPRNPPYVPKYSDGLETHTIRMDTITNISINYNAHSLYGYLESVATVRALKALSNSRPFVLTRSTFAGSGNVCSHWLGDNDSSWKSMYESIPGILNMNLFGVNHVGADICGFGGNSNDELCTRWMQLGSYYPFSRNHNTIGSIPQEPYAFGDRLIQISKQVLSNRYALLPYYYTLFYRNHVNGGTLWRALWWEFAQDTNAYNVDRQFLVGPALLVSPVLDQGATKVNAYFPGPNVWYDYYTGQKVSNGQQTLELAAPIDVINTHIRGGYIVPKQTPALTTVATRANPFQFVVALSENGSANGELFIDDGESLDSIANEDFTLIRYTAITRSGFGVLSSQFIVSKYVKTASMSANQLQFYGVSKKVCSVVSTSGGAQLPFTYNDATKVMTVTASFSMNTNWGVQWNFC